MTVPTALHDLPKAARTPPRERHVDRLSPSEMLALAHAIARGGAPADLSPEAWHRVTVASACVANASARGQGGYGVDTGVGALAAAPVRAGDLAEYQRRLLRSHAAGCGAPLSRHQSALVLLLRLRVISRGFSGTAPHTVSCILTLLRNGVLPIIPSRGSVGASGDLAPLAHAMLPLIGEGACTVPPDARELTGRDALALAGLAPITLGPKEALSLMNGTALSTALALEGTQRATQLLHCALLVTGLLVHGLRGRRSPFDARIAAAHGYAGTARVAHAVRHLLAQSEHAGHGEAGQDPYSLRCTPQILGAVHDELAEAWRGVTRACDSVSDNPLIDVESGAFISGGNFHGIAVGRICDRVSLCVSNMASLLDRQLAYAIDGTRTGLPHFLIADAGVNCGFMMHQVTTAALASECRLLAIPAGLETIPTSNGQEDHVPMAPLSGLRLLDALDRAMELVTIAFLGAVQACRLNETHQPRGPIAELLAEANDTLPPLVHDRVLAPDLAIARELMLAHAERDGLYHAVALS